MSPIVTAVLGITNNGLGLAREIIKRKLPKEVKKFKELEMEKLHLENKIKDYHAILPSKRIQKHLETYYSEYEKVCNEISVKQKYAYSLLNLPSD